MLDMYFHNILYEHLFIINKNNELQYIILIVLLINILKTVKFLYLYIILFYIFTLVQIYIFHAYDEEEVLHPDMVLAQEFHRYNFSHNQRQSLQRYLSFLAL